MKTLNRILVPLTLCALLLLAAVELSGKPASQWSDGQGGTFKAEPVEALGPFAIFKTSAGAGRRMLFRQLSLEECRRFYEGLDHEQKPAAVWSEAKRGSASALIGRTYQVADGKLVAANLSKRPEPQVVVLYFGSGWGPQTYETVFKFWASYARLKRLYGDRFEVVFMGVRHNAEAQVNVSTATRMPWLVAGYDDQANIPDFVKFAPAEGERMIALTRSGVPVVDSKINTTQELAKFIDQLSALLNASEAGNQMFWSDIARYQAVIRPIVFEKGSTPPLIVSNPFIFAALRKGGMARVKATLQVSAEGKIVSATLDPEAQVPDKYREQVTRTLVAYCTVLPGLAEGKPVDGSCVFDLIVPPTDERQELDRRWINSVGQADITINSWLLLRPIPVPETEFSQVVGKDDKGVTQMSAMKVGGDDVSKKSQLNAFKTDFFAETGAGSVTPVAGQVQAVGDVTYTWEPVGSADGLVDFANKTRTEFAVGYAYAEFDCEKAGAALMGLGSDDGVKIWLNGVLVKDSWVRRNTRIDEDLVPLTLLAGKNRLLVKIQNMKGEWSFFTRIRR